MADSWELESSNYFEMSHKLAKHTKTSYPVCEKLSAVSRVWFMSWFKYVIWASCLETESLGEENLYHIMPITWCRVLNHWLGLVLQVNIDIFSSSVHSREWCGLVFAFVIISSVLCHLTTLTNLLWTLL